MREVAEWLQATPLSVWIQSVTWIIPLLQSIHIVMIGVVFVSSVMLSRCACSGEMRADEPFASVWQRFSPWMWVGITRHGHYGAPADHRRTGARVLRDLLLGQDGVDRHWRGRRDRHAHHSEADCTRPAGRPEFPAGAKIVAIATIVIWIGVIFFGRAIAYDGAVWG